VNQDCPTRLALGTWITVNAYNQNITEWQRTVLSSEPCFRVSNAFALPSLNVSPLDTTYILRMYLSKLRGSIKRSISAVWPPEPRTMTILAEDFREGRDWDRNEGRIHISRINDKTITPNTTERRRVITEFILISSKLRKSSHVVAVRKAHNWNWWIERQCDGCEIDFDFKTIHGWSSCQRNFVNSFKNPNLNNLVNELWNEEFVIEGLIVSFREWIAS